jgi:hypothetical protein
MNMVIYHYTEAYRNYLAKDYEIVEMILNACPNAIKMEDS